MTGSTLNERPRVVDGESRRSPVFKWLFLPFRWLYKIYFALVFFLVLGACLLALQIQRLLGHLDSLSRQLAHFAFGVVLNLVHFHIHLVFVEFLGAFHGNPFAQSHRKGTGQQSRHARQQHFFIAGCGPGNAHNQTEIGYQSVVAA